MTTIRTLTSLPTVPTDGSAPTTGTQNAEDSSGTSMHGASGAGTAGEITYDKYGYGTPSNHAALGTNTYGQPGMTPRGILDSTPTVAPSTKPADYSASLSSGKEKLSNTGPLTNLSTGAALLAAENGKNLRKGSSLSNADMTPEQKKDVVTSQTEAVAESASKAEKRDCKQTKYENHDEMKSKIQNLGFSSKQSSALTRMFEDGRISHESKQHLASQLAALGLTGAGEGNNRAMVSNSEEVKKGLAELADKSTAQFDKLDKAKGAGGEGTKIAGLSGLIGSTVERTFGRSVMYKVDQEMKKQDVTLTYDGSTATQVTQAADASLTRRVVNDANAVL